MYYMPADSLLLVGISQKTRSVLTQLFIVASSVLYFETIKIVVELCIITGIPYDKLCVTV